MPYFDFFIAGSWAFVIGWYVGAIHVQNRAEGTETSRVAEETQTFRVSEKAEPCPDCHGWRPPVQTVSEVAAD